jgi:hypothetical protein
LLKARVEMQKLMEIATSDKEKAQRLLIEVEDADRSRKVDLN